MKKFNKLLENLSRINFCILLFIILITLIVLIADDGKKVMERPAHVSQKHILTNIIRTKENEIVTERSDKDGELLDLASLSTEDLIDYYIEDICKKRYSNVDPEVIKSQVYYESRYNPDAIGGNGAYLGLMQISPRWHTERANKLGVVSLTSIYGNLLVGIDYMSELLTNNDLPLALMIYNGVSDPYTKYQNGELNDYTKNVLTRAGYLGGDEYAS